MPRLAPLEKVADAALRIAAVAAVAALAAGCSWVEKYRDARPRETLELESFTLTAPDGPGWRVSRTRTAETRVLKLAHSGRSGIDGWIIVSERPADSTPVAREKLRGMLRAELPEAVGDPDAAFSEVASEVDPRFGPSAVQVLARAEQTDAKAGLLVKLVASGARFEFVPPQAPDRICEIVVNRRRRGESAAELEQGWRALLDDVALRPADAAAVRAAGRGDFPKTLQPGLARRSLTLPRGGFSLAYDGERWVAPGSWESAGRLALGLTDRLQLETPAFLRHAFGDPEALVGPEVAVGAGLTRAVEHDATRGNVWPYGIKVTARQRIADAVALRGAATLEATHASRTGANALGAAGAAGVVWDVLGGFVSLGLEGGYGAADLPQPGARLAWIGGRATPLVSVHFPPLDVGFTGGVGWDGGGAGVLAGVAVELIF